MKKCKDSKQMFTNIVMFVRLQNILLVLLNKSNSSDTKSCGFKMEKEVGLLNENSQGRTELHTNCPKNTASHDIGNLNKTFSDELTN